MIFLYATLQSEGEAIVLEYWESGIPLIPNTEER